MRAIIPVFQRDSNESLYIQLYKYIKEEILHGYAVPGEKLPSLRNLSSSLGISLTTTEQAYNQLLVEGYISSRPHSGFYVNDLGPSAEEQRKLLQSEKTTPSGITRSPSNDSLSTFLYDISSFDFVKWKKCMNQIINNSPERLLSEGSPAGEEDLRKEIAQYVFQSRGVSCDSGQIVTAAGTQQVISLLSNVLKAINISTVACEDPGYLPVRTVFQNKGVTVIPIPVGSQGIEIDKLPTNIGCAAYISPSNQFPTGAVIPVGRRYQLLEWAEENDSYIIEDDYDSELRYFGRPIPALQSLDHNHRVIYLGSFSSTVFAAIRISYVILPPSLSKVFEEINGNYSQTCSKMEQLTLALFMKEGHYQRGIRKMRRLYTRKLQQTIDSFRNCSFVNVGKAASGLNVLLHVSSKKSSNALCKEAATLGLRIQPTTMYSHIAGTHPLIFYYNQVPLKDLPRKIAQLLEAWES